METITVAQLRKSAEICRFVLQCMPPGSPSERMALETTEDLFHRLADKMLEQDKRGQQN
jgi:hypothetical protein